MEIDKLTCAECGKPVDKGAIGFQCETFIVCRPCNQQVEEDWETTKRELRAEGHQIPCKWILEQGEELENGKRTN